MPEVGKDFPILNGMSNLISAPPSGPASNASQGSPLDRAGILGSTVLQSQQQQGGTGPQQQGSESSQSSSQIQVESKETESTMPSNPLTAIFRPDEGGEWKEKLRQAHEASELARAGQPAGSAVSGAASWERRSGDEEEEVKSDEEPDVEDEDATDIGDSDSGKIWKVKRTLRKSVSSS